MQFMLQAIKKQLLSAQSSINKAEVTGSLVKD